jgi:putative acetyltransferase
MPPDVSIRPFQPGDEAAFRSLNEEWIAQYFKIEPADEMVLSDPQGAIVGPGGQILFATRVDVPIGCGALLRISDREYEVAKMAVRPQERGNGIGREVLQALIECARSRGATRLYLETNRMLTPAIRLYESLGFREVADGDGHESPYARSDLKMELML